jgi:hypothetical protein
VASLVARYANEAVVGTGRVCGSLESGGQFCIGTFVRDLASVAMNRFSYFIYFIKEFYKCCTLSAVCNDNAAVSYITVQHKKVHSHKL